VGIQISDLNAGNAVLASNTLTFSTFSNAIDGWDAHDVNVPFIIAGLFQSFFPLGSDTLDPHYHLTTDARNCGDPTHTWKIKATNVADHLEAHWNRVDFLNPSLPEGAIFKIGISTDAVIPPADSTMLNMRDYSVLRDIPANAVIWITYNRFVDTTPFEVRYQSPAPGDTNVCTTDSIHFQIVDFQSGVNLPTVQVFVHGVDVTADCIFTSVVAGLGYDVVLLHPSLTILTDIDVRVVGDNNAIPPNHQDYTYTFRTGPGPCSITWSAGLTIRGVRAPDTSQVVLTFGQDPAGTDGYDAGLDGIAPPPPPPPNLDRVFSITASRPEFERLLRDIRSSSDTLIQWKIITSLDETDYSPLWVSWNIAALPIRLQAELSIWESFGADPGEPTALDNMHNDSTFTFTSNANVYIRYHARIPLPQALNGFITLEDHIDHSGTPVRLASTTSSYVANTITASNGSYSFPGLSVGRYHLTASRDSFVTLDTLLDLNEGANSFNWELKWPRYDFCGTVTLTGGADNAGAAVQVTGGTNAITDAAGNFHILVPFNGLSHAVMVSKPRYTVAYDTVVVPEGAPCDHNYSLDLTCFGISGHITMGDGSSPAGVQLAVGGINAVSQADGSYSFDSCLVNNSYMLTAHADCFVDQSATINVTGGGVIQDFTMPRAIVSLTGTISLPSGGDQSGTQVTVGATSISTDVTGNYSIDGLNCGQVISIHITRANYATIDTSITVIEGTIFSATLTACSNALAFAVANDTDQVVLTWNLPTIPGLTWFRIFKDGGILDSVRGTATTYTDRSVAFGETHTYNIQAVYLLCESTPLGTPITVTVVHAVPPARILIVDFDNNLTYNGTGVSNQVFNWLSEAGMAGPTGVLALNQNEQPARYDQAWLNHFEMIILITANNGPSREYFDTASAAKLNNYISTPGKKMYWEGATALQDITHGTMPGIYGTLLSHFGVTQVAAGASSTVGNAQYLDLNNGWYYTHVRFGYAYQTVVDDGNDVVGGTGTGAVILSSIVDTAAPLGRIVKTDNTAFSSIYSAGATSSDPRQHNGRRLWGPFICTWLSICPGEVQESPYTSVEKPTLYQNEPNPFSNLTTIRFAVPTEGATKLDVYTVTGEHLSTLLDKTLSAGTYSVDWESGSLTSGVYLYRLTTPTGATTKAMTVSK